MTKKITIGAKPQSQPTVPATADDWVNAATSSAEPASPASSMPEIAMKRLTIDIPEPLHTQVKSKCAQRGVKMADAIRALLEEQFAE